MTSRFAGISQWVSPVCFGVVVVMVWLGSGASEPVFQGWIGVIFWAACGALATIGTIAAAYGVLAAQQHLRVARTQIQRLRKAGEKDGRLVPIRRGEFRS